MNPQMILMIVGLIAVFYFFMIRPQQKKTKAQNEMRNSLSVGVTVTTIGGLIGKVVYVDNDKLVFETSSDGVRIAVAKWAVAAVGDTSAGAPDR